MAFLTIDAQPQAYLLAGCHRRNPHGPVRAIVVAQQNVGVVAAGLAHELSNPATAARRAATDLRQSVEKVQDYACELNETLSAERMGSSFAERLGSERNGR